MTTIQRITSAIQAHRLQGIIICSVNINIQDLLDDPLFAKQLRQSLSDPDLLSVSINAYTITSINQLAPAFEFGIDGLYTDLSRKNIEDYYQSQDAYQKGYVDALISKGRLIAHRGCHIHETENTMPAFEIGLSQYGRIETDARSTSDSNITLFHDPDYSGHVISETSLSTLQSLASQNNDPDLFPSLQSLLDLFGKYPESTLILELKENVSIAPIISTLKDHENAHDIRSRISFTSFHFSLIADIHHAYHLAFGSDPELGLLFESGAPIL